MFFKGIFGLRRDFESFKIPFFGNDNKLSVCEHMIVRIVSALNVLGDRNTGEDFGTVCYLKIHQNLVSECIQTRFQTVEIVRKLKNT
jgi:hypothetical protein